VTSKICQAHSVVQGHPTDELLQCWGLSLALGHGSCHVGDHLADIRLAHLNGKVSTLATPFLGSNLLPILRPKLLLEDGIPGLW
jgi:hypothetical protein